MSKVPLGKVLLRNIIRHTDAHNKIQEESEMWRQRDMELQAPPASASSHRWTSTGPCARGNMHCDRYFLEGSTQDRLGERDEREACYWTRKLYEFEARDTDRWGHSGFKELYPEEFESDRLTANESVRTAKRKCPPADGRAPKSPRRGRGRRGDVRGVQGLARRRTAAWRTTPGGNRRGRAARANTATGRRSADTERDRRAAANQTEVNQTRGQKTRTEKDTELQQTRSQSLKGKSVKTGKLPMKRNLRKTLRTEYIRH
ncbi:uncharacterized protein NKAPD1 isoform X2 [Brachyhypopomus gauderio]|uniref:uncharacterized protein NKAPD1 isoform X2 n=1 Tax=Brachyhypopomus gauderio TaxID=698409 RepID=UPI0040414A7F